MSQMSYKRRFRTLWDAVMQRIGFVVFPGFQVMGFAVISAFEFANVHLGEPVYDVQLLSETGGAIPASMGMSVMAKPFGDTKVDTLIIGGRTVVDPSTPGLIRFGRRGLGRNRPGAPNPADALLPA